MIEFHWLKFNFIHEHSHDKPVARMAGGEIDGQKKRSDADRTDNRYGRIGRTGQIKLGVKKKLFSQNKSIMFLFCMIERHIIPDFTKQLSGHFIGALMSFPFHLIYISAGGCSGFEYE